jgi:hypothetical protein
MRRLFTLGAIGTVAVFGWGFVHRNDSSSANPPAAEPVAVATTEPPPCPPPAHTDEGAARLADEGLRQLTQARLGKADVTATVETYADPTIRDRLEDYLTDPRFRPPYTDLTSKVLAWEPVSYTSKQAYIRLATADSDGTTPLGQYVTDVLLEWNGPADTWRLLGYHPTPAANAVAQLTAPRVFCDAA